MSNMGKTLYSKLKIMLEGKKELTHDELGNLIFMHIGSDKRTFDRAILTLKKLNMIEEKDDIVHVRNA